MHRADLQEQPSQFYFIHIPKTAGTTFLRLLYQHEPHHLIYPDAYEHFILNHGQHVPPQQLFQTNDIKAILARRKWIIGHFTYRSVHQIAENPEIITFLRNPFDRVISELVHLKLKSPDYQQLTMSQIIEKRKNVMGCRSAISFGYHPRKENLQQAIEHLSHCRFVGLTDHYEDSLKACNRLIGTDFSASSHQNVGHPAMLAEVADKFGDHIASLLDVDNKFYQAGQNIFADQ